MAGVEFTKQAAELMAALPADVAERYAAVILAVGADPYGVGRPLSEPSSPDRVVDLEDGWLLYTVRDREPNVLLLHIGWVGGAE